MKYAALSHKGNARKKNEDSYYIPDGKGPDNLAIVADGMGGYHGGEVASAMSVEVVCNYIAANKPDAGNSRNRAKVIIDAIKAANSAVYDYAATNEFLYGMGTTMVLLYVVENTAMIANIGDSRGYLVRAKKIRQITTDHSLVQELVEQGRLSAAEARNHPHKNIITRAIGSGDQSRADIYELTLQPDDVILLCSDGLNDCITDEDILHAVNSNDTINDAATELVAKALADGGRDDVTVVIAHAGGREAHR